MIKISWSVWRCYEGGACPFTFGPYLTRSEAKQMFKAVIESGADQAKLQMHLEFVWPWQSWKSK